MNPAIRLDQHIYQKRLFPFALTDILTEYSKEHQQIFYISGNMTAQSS